MVEETEEEGEEEDEEEGLEYTTNTPSGGSYTTPPSTGGCLSPSPALSRLPTPGDSDPENNAALHTEELEAHIEAIFLCSRIPRRFRFWLLCFRVLFPLP